MKHTPIALALALALGCGTLAAQTAQPGATTSDAAKPTPQAVAQIIESWPSVSKFAARQTIDKYGPPAEATPTRLVWFNNGPWKRTTVLKEETDHAFPMPHKDVMEQVVNYQVPADKFDDLARFDGSVYVDRTRGEISARCDMEAANLVALNLAHDIVTGKRSVEDARKFYPQAVMAHMMKKPSPYAEKLQFAAKSNTGFPDKTIVSKQMQEKAKQMKQAMMEKEKAEAPVGATR